MALFFRGKRAFPDFADVVAERRFHGAARIAEDFEEGALGAESEDVVHDEDLAVAVGSGADADRGDGEHLGDFGGGVLLDEFEHEGETAGLLEAERFFRELLPGLVAAPLDLVAAELVDGLRGDPIWALRGCRS